MLANPYYLETFSERLYFIENKIKYSKKIIKLITKLQEFIFTWIYLIQEKVKD